MISYWCIDQVVCDALRGDRAVMTKSSVVDLVTQTDQKVEQLIIQSVKEKFPTHRYEAPPPLCMSSRIIDHQFTKISVMIRSRCSGIQLCAAEE